MTAGRLFI